MSARSENAFAAFVQVAPEVPARTPDPELAGWEAEWHQSAALQAEFIFGPRGYALYMRSESRRMENQ